MVTSSGVAVVGRHARRHGMVVDCENRVPKLRRRDAGALSIASEDRLALVDRAPESGPVRRSTVVASGGAEALPRLARDDRGAARVRDRARAARETGRADALHLSAAPASAP